MKDLETITETRSLGQRAQDAATNYLVDVSAGLIFYNIVGVLSEHFIAGMDNPKMIKSRIAASLMQAVFLRPIGMLRNYSAKTFELTKESPWYQKTASDVVSTWVIQLPTYALALNYSGASLWEGSKALGIGALSTLLLGRPYGKWNDFWRKTWGKKPAIR